MLTTNLKLLSTLTVAGVLSGCTAYSTAVNSLGPDRAVSDLQDLDKEYVLSSVSPLFCPAPEIYMVMPLENKGTLDVQLNNGEAYALEENYSAVSVSEQERKQFTGDQE